MISRSPKTRTLRTDSLPMRLYEKAKDAGAWNPAHLDFSVDKAHWNRLRGEDRVPVLAMAVLNAHALRTKLHNQAAILVHIERYGSIEESLCYSSQVFETARYVELHNHLLEELFELVGDPQRFHLTRFQSFCREDVPRAVDKLQRCSEPKSLVEALTLAGPLMKGVLGATSVQMFVSMIERLEIMPTTLSAMRDLQMVEERHNEFEIFFIGRLMQQDPTLWEVVDEAMNAGFEPAVGMVREFFDKFSSNHVTRAEAVTHAVECFSECYERLERAREHTFADKRHGFRHSRP